MQTQTDRQGRILTGHLGRDDVRGRCALTGRSSWFLVVTQGLGHVDLGHISVGPGLQAAESRCPWSVAGVTPTGCSGTVATRPSCRRLHACLHPGVYRGLRRPRGLWSSPVSPGEEARTWQVAVPPGDIPEARCPCQIL